MNFSHNTFLNTTTFGSRFQVFPSSLISIFRIILVLILRAGLVLIQFGTIPTESFYDLLLQNIVEFTVSTTSYGLVGVLLSFGSKSFKGIIGYGPWDHTKLELDNIIFGFCSALIGSAIVTTFVSSRLHLVGCTVIALAYCGVAQPIIMHWIWHKNGWMNNGMAFNKKVSLDDHGGGLVVHTSSGVVGVIGLAFLGRRLLRLRNVDESSLGPESPSTTLVGYFFLIVGLLGFSLPTKITDIKHEHSYSDVVLINNLLALSGGSIAGIIMEFIIWKENFNYWVILRCMQGCISGLVFISASVDACYPPLSFAITLVGSMLSNIISKVVYKSAIEDYCNLMTVHLFCGIWASILSPIIRRLNHTAVNWNDVPFELLWTVTCVFTVVIFTISIFMFMFLMLWCSGFLRNKIEENCHNRSMKLSKKFEECPVKRFFILNSSDNMIEPGLSGKTYSDTLKDHSSTKTAKRLVQNLNKSNANRTTIKPNIKKHTQSEGNVPLEPALKMFRKSKHIYTIPNVNLINKNSTNNQAECAFSSGDIGNLQEIYKLEDLIDEQKMKTMDKQNFGKTQTMRLKNKVLRKKSHHKLTKSKKYIDFSKNKRVKKELINKNNILVPIDIEREVELVTYDAQYNDGITSYKIPAEHFSSSSSD